MQLGFLYYLFEGLNYSLNGILLTKLFGRVYPLLFLELIFYFGVNILKEGSVDNHVIILAYINFTLLTLFAGIITSFLNKFGNEVNIRSSFDSIMIHLSYYLSFA